MQHLLGGISDIKNCSSPCAVGNWGYLNSLTNALYLSQKLDDIIGKNF